MIPQEGFITTYSAKGMIASTDSGFTDNYDIAWDHDELPDFPYKTVISKTVYYNFEDLRRRNCRNEDADWAKCSLHHG